MARFVSLLAQSISKVSCESVELINVHVGGGEGRMSRHYRSRLGTNSYQ